MILQDDILERRVMERAPSYFGRYFRRVRVIPIEEWAEKLDDALENGLINEDEKKDATSLDVLIRAKTEDGRNILLAVEVSHTLEDKDAERASKRAKTFSKIYNMETIPVVVGVNIPEGFQEKHPKVLVVQAGYDN